MIQTATPSAALASLAFATTAGALASYGLARLTGSPRDYRDAADQLAVALRAEARRVREIPTVQASPAASAPKAARKPRVAASAPDSGLSADLANVPRGKAVVGDFVVEWADGTQTLVRGVTYHGGKPETRWAAAFQAADRLRRMRARHAYADNLGSLLRGRYETVSGLHRETAAFRRLSAIRPLAPAVAIRCGSTWSEHVVVGEFGAGDAVEAARLEASMCAARMPWRDGEVQRSSVRILSSDARGVAYLHANDGRFPNYGDRCTGLADGGPDYLASRRRDVEVAFERDDMENAPPPAPKAEPSAQLVAARAAVETARKRLRTVGSYFAESLRASDTAVAAEAGERYLAECEAFVAFKAAERELKQLEG